MRTAIDSSLILDILGADPEFGERSRVALRKAYDQGALVACDVVWAEVSANYSGEPAFSEAMSALGIEFKPLLPHTAADAGQRWRRYCLAHRKPRSRMVADFLIGAHALHQADALLCRDRGFYREQFRGLKVIDPTTR